MSLFIYKGLYRDIVTHKEPVDIVVMREKNKLQ